MEKEVERRRNIRAPIDVYMHIAVVERGGASFLLRADDFLKLRIGEVKNVSSHGVCVLTNDFEKKWLPALLAGRIQIALQFKVYSYKDPINAIGKVAWVKENEGIGVRYRYTVGIEFVDISLADQERLRHFCLQRGVKKREV